MHKREVVKELEQLIMILKNSVIQEVRMVNGKIKMEKKFLIRK